MTELTKFFPGENIILNKETGLISRQSIGEDNPEGWINDYINYNAITSLIW